jgi:uncharacterized protein YkwD
VTPWDRIGDAGYVYSAAAENVAGGYPTPALVVDGWLSSAGHCRNVMSSDVTEIGVAFFADESPHLHATYWVQVFAAPY